MSPEATKQHRPSGWPLYLIGLLALIGAVLLLNRLLKGQKARVLAEVKPRAEANVKALATMKAYEVLRAPFAGTVTARYADPGALLQNAANSQTSALPLVTISEIDRLRVYAYPDQHDATFVHAGDPAEITLSERPGIRLGARVTRLSGELDP